MSELRFKTWDRVLSIMLAVFIVLGSLPLSVSAAAQPKAVEGHYTIQVVDEKNRPLDGVTVSYTATKNYGDKDKSFIASQVLETENGMVELTELNGIEIKNRNAPNNMKFECTLEKDGYVTVKNEWVSKTLYEDKVFTLKKEKPSKIKYTVEKNGDGDGSVEVDGNNISSENGYEVDYKETDNQHKITIKANENSYIKSISVFEDEIENAVEISNNKIVTFDNIPSNDVRITVQFEREYNVKVTQNLGGCITYVNKDITEKSEGRIAAELKYKSDEFTEVFNKTYTKTTESEFESFDIKVNVFDGYIIDYVKINGEYYYADGTEKKEFAKNDITINDNVDVEVHYLKSFKVVVKYDAQSGKVNFVQNTDSEKVIASNQTYCFPQEDKILIVARPDEKFYVSSVQPNKYPSSRQIFEKDLYTSENEFSMELDSKKNNEITIEFAERTYDINFKISGEGAVYVNDQEVVKEKIYNETTKEYEDVYSVNLKYKSDAKITVAPDDDYYISSIKDNNTDVALGNEVDSKSPQTFDLGELKKDHVINVVFMKDQRATESFSWNYKDAVRRDDHVYLFKKDTQLNFKSTVNDTAYTMYYLEYKIKPDYGIFADELSTKIFVCNENAVSINASEVSDSRYFYRMLYHNNVLKKWFYADYDDDNNHMPFYIVTDEEKPVLNNEEKDARFIDTSDSSNGIKYPKVYTSDIELSFTAEDPKIEVDMLNTDEYDNLLDEREKKYIASGIKTVKYQLLDADDSDKLLKEGSLYEYGVTSLNDGAPIDTVYDSVNCDLQISSEEFNEKNIKVKITVTDRSDNSKAFYLNNGESYYINVTTPAIKVESDGKAKSENSAEKNYNFDREFTVSFNDYLFRADNAISCISIEKDNVQVSVQDYITVDSSKHKVTVKFDEDGYYKWKVDKDIYESGNGKKSENIETVGDDVYEFRIDKTSPTGKIGDVKNEQYINSWDAVPGKIDFNVWKKEPITIIAEGYDDNLAENSVLYYKSDGKKALKSSDLDALYEDDKANKGSEGYKPNFVADPYTVNSEEEFVIYARIIDNAGNYLYIGTNGYICDMSAPVLDIGLNVENSEVKQFNDDVKINVSVNEVPRDGMVYSGIKTVKYVISAPNMEDKEVTLYNFEYDKENNTYTSTEQINGKDNRTNGTFTKDVLRKDLITEINIDAKKYNTDGINVTLYAEDNAGNTSETAIDNLININSTIPEVTINFDENNPNRTEKGIGYFNTARTATITIKDRLSSFPQKDGKDIEPSEFVIIDSGSELENGFKTSDENIIISKEWTVNEDEHSFTISFNGDANYKWSFAGYTNQANNSANVKIADGVKSAYLFAVDQNAPTEDNCSIEIEHDSIKKYWNQLIRTITFGIFSFSGTTNNTVNIKATDNTTPVDIFYYIDTKNTAYNESPLEMLKKLSDNEWTNFDNSDLQKNGISDDNHYVIFVKAVDYAGNPVYFSSDGYIIDTQASVISITPLDKDGNAMKAGNNSYVYNKEYAGGINVNISVVEPEQDDNKNYSYSGIKLVEWWTQNNTDEEKQSKNNVVVAYEDKNSSHSYADLNKSFDATITIDPVINNRSDTILYVRTVDNAGNANVKRAYLDIDITPPKVDVVYSGKSNVRSSSANLITDKADSGYYTERTAKVIITERNEHFTEKTATDSITVNASDYLGNSIENAYLIGEWTTVSDEKDPDAATHTAEIKFIENANYTIGIDFSDDVNNRCEEITYDGKVKEDDTDSFTVDNNENGKPEGEISLDKETVWEKLAEVLTFGLWRNSIPTIEITAKDSISPIKSVYLYKDKDNNGSEKNSPLNRSELEELFNNDNDKFVQVDCENGTVKDVSANILDSAEDDQLFTVYARITDNAGNVEYISTEGIVLDRQVSEIEITPVYDQSNIYERNNKYFHKDFDVKISIDETVNEQKDSYSGIRKVSYTVNDGEKDTVDEVIYTFEGGENITKDQLKAKYVKTVTIPVSEDTNNVESLKIKVRVEDNAGNISENEKVVKVNATIPTAELSFDNNSSKRGKYYSAKRVATLKISDRHDTFMEEQLATSSIKITKKDVNGNIIDNGDTVGISWRKEGNSHIATITFDDDGNYSWSFVYTNLAGLSVVGGAQYVEETDVLKNAETVQGTSTPYDFTVDTTAPTGTISDKDNTYTWTNIINKAAQILTFNIFTPKQYDVKFDSKDYTGKYEISPTIISYYIDDGKLPLSKAELDTKTFSTDGQASVSTKSVSPNKRFTVYIKVQDYADNYVYIGSDGIVTDNTAPVIGVSVQSKPSNSNNIYTGDIQLTISLTEPNAASGKEAYSGIRTLKYQVFKNSTDSQPTQTKEIDFNDIRKTLDYDSLKATYSEKVVIDSKKNNSSDVLLVVTATDYAGNKTTQEYHYDIDITDPIISIDFDKNQKQNEGADRNYFTYRKAIITVKERSDHFDRSKLEAILTAEKLRPSSRNILNPSINGDYETLNGYKKVNVNRALVNWKDSKGATPDEDTHTAEYEFPMDAQYTFTLDFKDNAGRAAKTYDVEKFVVDTVAPTGDITSVRTDTNSNLGRYTNNTLEQSYIFRVMSATGINVTSAYSDDTSGVKSVQYYVDTASDINNPNSVLTKAQLDRITNWQIFSNYTVLPNTQCMIYLKIMDRSGNITYISSCALIVDNTLPVDEEVRPQITVSPQQPVNGIYNGDVQVYIRVDDPKVGGTYSGLNRVWYEVYDRASANPNTPTASGELYRFDTNNMVPSQLKKTYEGNIVVNSAQNNSNNVQVVVYAQDNAGNTTSNLNAGSRGFTILQIDRTAPVIDISYDNNTADQNVFFNKARKATVRITERNFDENDVKITVTNTDGTRPSISGWTRTEGTLNQDNTVYTATIDYQADGDYKFDIQFKDKAGNACNTIRFAEGTVASKEFTIDRTAPKVVSVNYDYNNVKNGNYYDGKRTATVTIEEHNFDSGRVNVVVKGSDDGNEISAPKISNWSTSGNIHTATIEYKEDGYYTFDITLRDMAGNRSEERPTEKFYIDTKAPVLKITGIENGSANKGKVAPIITYSDTNLSNSDVSIILTGSAKGNIKLDGMGSYSDIHNGKVFTFTNLPETKDNDDIYTLTAKIVDKAGNSSSQTLVYSVNRKGSTFDVSSEAKNINGKCINTPVDIVISEINVDEINSHQVIVYKNHESTELKENTDYKVEKSGGDGKWYKYTYTIFKDNFDTNGNYSIEIKSTDKANNRAVTTNDDKNINLEFTVDKKNPEISFQNIEKGATYALDNLNVKFRINELNLSKVEIYLDNELIKAWEGNALETVIKGDSVFAFDIPGTSTSAHTIRAVAYDKAGNTEENIVDNVYVTTNLWIRYYNNKPLFFGSIGGFVGLVALIILLVILKRRKKEKSK